MISLVIPACTTPQAAVVCGDGRREATEGCDDGNTTAGDGCSATCTAETALDAGPLDTGPDLDSGPTPDAPTPADAFGPDVLALDGSAPDAPIADVGALPDGAIGQVCGSRGAAPCAAGLDCVFPLGAICGRAGAGGTCQLRPTTCSGLTAPVCGCDGLDYGNECEARRAGTSALSSGACPISCDPDVVTCDGIPPRCAAGSVPRVVAGCWDGCVPLTTCECATAADCPGTAPTCTVLGNCSTGGPAT